MNTRRKLLLGLATGFSACLAVYLAGELGLRAIRVFRPPRAVSDRELGWRMNAHVYRRMQGIRADGAQYGIDFSTGPHGFRIWGDTATRKRRLLVLGDSFTEAYQVSNDKTYYAVLKALAGEDWELFAYGEGGYGTLQEYMILARYIAIIKPDVVLWQWCGNDLCNNSYEWESQTLENFSLVPRPYLENDEIRVRCPHYVPLLSYHSALWQYLAPRVAKRVLGGATSPGDRVDRDSPLMRSAAKATDGILKRAKALLGGTRAYVFVVGSGEVPDILSRLAKDNGFRSLDRFDEALREQERAGIVIGAHPSIGGHWSEQGHAAVARILYEAILEDGGFKETEPAL